ncbi:MAG: hypothetical protein QM687_17430 [Ferruginibacter sp.]
MDGHAESPWESLLRVLHRACGFEVETQHEVRDAAGTFVARGDLWLRGARVLHEYDGAGHRERETQVRDLDRDRRLLNAGWIRRAYTAREVALFPQEIVADACLSLGRGYRADLLDTWLAMWGESLYAPGGTDRLLARLTGREPVCGR